MLQQAVASVVLLCSLHPVPFRQPLSQGSFGGGNDPGPAKIHEYIAEHFCIFFFISVLVRSFLACCLSPYYPLCTFRWHSCPQGGVDLAIGSEHFDFGPTSSLHAACLCVTWWAA